MFYCICNFKELSTSIAYISISKTQGIQLSWCGAQQLNRNCYVKLICDSYVCICDKSKILKSQETKEKDCNNSK